MFDQSLSEQELQFEKLRREITFATRAHGDDPAQNRRLRVALQRAKDLNMPDDMRQAARALGTNAENGPHYEERLYEGYGDAGIAVLVRAITASPHATQADLEQLFEEHGGNLGDDGCVAWQFKRRGVIEVDQAQVDDPDEFLLDIIEWGAQELEPPTEGAEDQHYRVYCEPNDLDELDDALSRAHEVASASIIYQPEQKIPVEPAVAKRFLQFFERLLAHPDVQRAHANWKIAS